MRAQPAVAIRRNSHHRRCPRGSPSEVRMTRNPRGFQASPKSTKRCLRSKQRIVGDEKIVWAKVVGVNQSGEREARGSREFGEQLLFEFFEIFLGLTLRSVALRRIWAAMTRILSGSRRNLFSRRAAENPRDPDFPALGELGRGGIRARKHTEAWPFAMAWAAAGDRTKLEAEGTLSSCKTRSNAPRRTPAGSALRGPPNSKVMVA